MRALLKSLEVDGAKQIQLLTSIDSSGAGTRILGVGSRARPADLDRKKPKWAGSIRPHEIHYKVSRYFR